MRIIKLEIQDFRAFYGNHIIEFAKEGERGKQNLLLYGENGSGKSSLLLAIQYVLESSTKGLDFDDYRNIFQSQNSRYIELTLRESTNKPNIISKWSPDINTTDIQEIRDAAQAKGILDYKKLLEVHFVHRQESKVNIFDLLVKSLLAQCINDITPTKTFSQQWQELVDTVPKRPSNTRQIPQFQQSANLFNSGLQSKLNELQNEISSLINYFSHAIKISFDFQGVNFNYDAKYNPENKENSIKDKEIFLNIKLLNELVDSPHHFLNEAKLTAIAISIYLSSLLIAPKPKLKLLVLDDIFIGLDMSNRLPLIDIIKEKFSEYQIFLMTYDREWYEILKQRLDGNKWIYKELYRGEIKIKDDDGNEKVIAEVPIWKQDKDYLEKAKDYLNIHHEPRIAAVYLRIAFEVILKEFCNAKGIKIIYKEEVKKLSSDDFWKEVRKAKKNDGTLYVDELLAFDIDIYRSIIMNPLSHSRIIQTYSGEVGERSQLSKS
ncbi:MAG: AAA family ATPase [Coleofasciculaceae cyanobacterium SM2_1_6]|nr:AAA family ATPase [Coleofasciculaceae cyanobacterium SM2_1_6]